jgi:hypothetical protein
MANPVSPASLEICEKCKISGSTSDLENEKLPSGGLTIKLKVENHWVRVWLLTGRVNKQDTQG